MGEDRVAPRTAHPKMLRLDGPIILVQSDKDPGDMGEPRTVWSDADNALVVVVPSFVYWEAEAASLDSDELRKLRAIEKAARDLNMTMPDLGDGDPMSDLDDALADYDEWLDAQDRALLSTGDKAEAPK